MIEATQPNERSRAAELLLRLERTNDALRRTQDVADALARTRTVAEVAEVALAQGLAATRAAAGTIYLYDEEQEILRLTGSAGYAEPLLRGFERIAPDSSAPLAVAVRTGEPLFAQHSPHTPAPDLDLRSDQSRPTTTAIAAVPLVVNGRPLGVLGLSFDAVRTFPEDERAFLVGIARQCAQALDRARLFESERRGREIAERMRAEAEAAERRSREADHRKDQFLAMLGHELRNPLAPILTALELMRMKGGREFERERTIIARQVEHVVRLVDDLLDVSRVTGGKLTLRQELVDVGAAVSKAIEMTSPLLEQRSQRLEVDIDDDGRALHVKGDIARLAQVVANLLNNAAKYTEQGGRIELSAKRDGEHVVIRVRDHGIGISKEALPQIFESFVQEARSLHRAQGGLGLGLTIVRSLVESHGGTVTAHSEGAKRGSLFTVRLPAASVGADAPLASTEGRFVSGVGIAAVPQRVLVVDDNPDAAATLADALAAAGHDTRVAHDGPTALRIAATFHPEVAVLDIGLPVMDGFELAERLKNANHVRLVAVTGYGQESDVRRARAAGFDAHFVKPVNLERLLDAVDGAE